MSFHLEAGSLVQYDTLQPGKNLRTIGINLLRLSSAFPALRVKVKVKLKVKVKVKFTLEQATKTERRSRDIAVLFP